MVYETRRKTENLTIHKGAALRLIPTRASPVKLGRLPVPYPWVWLMFQKAATQANMGKVGTHALRHTYRSWLDAVGTPTAVQQKLMRHADIRTTLNMYGDVVTNEMAQAHSKLVRMAMLRAS